MLSMGIDAGSYSWRIATIDGDEVVGKLELEGGSRVLEHIKEVVKATPEIPIALPSGFGSPLKVIERVSEEELLDMTLKRDVKEVMGLTKFLSELRSMEVNAYVTPAVKHLSTVPTYRKVNSIDMGTADKLCAVVYTVSRLAGVGAGFEDLDFIQVDLGYAFKCLTVVKGGKVIDGIGGTRGSMGIRARGGMDGEVVCLMKPTKKEIYQGGMNYIPEHGRAAFREGLAKELLMLSLYYDIEKVIAIGRNANSIREVLPYLKGRLEVEIPAGPHATYEPALGAAMLVEGALGGMYKPLIEWLEIKEASGNVLDYLY